MFHSFCVQKPLVVSVLPSFRCNLVSIAAHSPASFLFETFATKIFYLFSVSPALCLHDDNFGRLAQKWTPIAGDGPQLPGITRLRGYEVTPQVTRLLGCKVTRPNAVRHGWLARLQMTQTSIARLFATL